MALSLYRPSRRVNTVLAPAAFAIPTAVMAVLADSFLFTGFLITSGLAVFALVVHPACRSLARADVVAAVDRRVAGLFALGAGPLLGYAGLEVAKQLGPVDDHVLFVHYGAMAIAAILVVVTGTVGLVRRRDWRVATWTAGTTAAFLGVVSVVYPENPSSVGAIGGLVVVGWALAFVVSVERTRRGGVGSAPDTNEGVGAEAGAEQTG